jgi:cytochrome c553
VRPGCRTAALPRFARRRLTLALVAALAACGGERDTLSPAERGYLTDAASRRRALVDSLVNPTNAYSTVRLAHYASGDANDWELLPEWNPRVAPVATVELDAPATTTPLAGATPLALDEVAAAPTDEALRALGEAAFFRYPSQLAAFPALSLTRASADHLGLWVDDARGVGGLVRAEVAGGDAALAMTCATCHADVREGRVVAGVPSARFDLGLALLEASGGATPFATNLSTWGPGRVDVTTVEGTLPERISDLRPLRWVSHLQYDATVRQPDVVALAIRLETLIITGHAQAVRPPRLVTLALARYLWSLADALPPPPRSDGARVFAGACGSCHAGPGLTGAPRALAEIGTDPALGLSPDRGTGFYRVPSLRGVSSRPTLLHDGSARDLAALFDPTRVDETYTGGARGPGPVPGHVFGLDLPASDRGALVAFLGAL